MKHFLPISIFALFLMSCSNSATDSNPGDLNSSESSKPNAESSSEKTSGDLSSSKENSSANHGSSSGDPVQESSSSENGSVSVPESSSSVDPVPESSNSTLVKPVNQFCIDNAEKCGVYTLNGQDHQTVVVGTQTWFAENLKDDDCTGDCLVTGSYFDWYELTGGQSTGENDVPSLSQGLCGPGWHVPSPAEFGILLDYINVELGLEKQYGVSSSWDDAAMQLASVEGWPTKTGLNTFGLNISPYGYYEKTTLTYPEISLLWSSYKVDDGSQMAMSLIVSEKGFGDFTTSISKDHIDNKLNVRCLKN